jgi:transposase
LDNFEGSAVYRCQTSRKFSSGTALDASDKKVRNAVEDLDLFVKKKTLIAAEQSRPDVTRRGAQWVKYRERIDPSRLVFIDETWTKTNMAPLRVWAPRGQRIRAKVPHGRWQTMTFLAALRHDRITAPWLIEGPVNGETFQLYVEKVLVPTLRPGDIVIMDNLGSHKANAVRRAIRAAGAHLFFLPKYSPDLNPIEQFFAKFKHWLREAAKRTIEAVYNAIGPILDTVSSAECANYFANAGYH